jgi:hypothetical protein
MSPVLGIIASSNQQGRGGVVGSYDALATVTVPSGGLASITFAGIPSGYEHLQIRYMGISSYPLISSNLGAGTTGHYLYGTGNGVPTSYNFSPLSAGMYVAIDGDVGAVSAGVIDILDYASVTKNKTFRSLHGRETNTINSSITFASGFWNNINPISSVTITNNVAGGVAFAQNSQFALYGVK